MLLKPQDVAVALQLAISDPGGWTYAGVGQGLFLSAAEVHNAVRRAVQAGLLVRIGRQAPAPSRHNLLEFLVHGVRYSFPPDLGGSTRGFPTGHAAPAFRMQFAPTGEPPPVWPDPAGPVRGFGFSPLYGSAAKAARADDTVYRMLAAIDLLRGGGARERKVGGEALAGILGTGRRE